MGKMHEPGSEKENCRGEGPVTLRRKRSCTDHSKLDERRLGPEKGHWGGYGAWSPLGPSFKRGLEIASVSATGEGTKGGGMFVLNKAYEPGNPGYDD